MNLDTIKEKLAQRAFEHYKTNPNIKQAYLTNGTNRFCEYVRDTLCYHGEILEFTDVYKKGLTMEEMGEKHFLELKFIELLDEDIDYRDSFGNLIAQKLITYYG